MPFLRIKSLLTAFLNFSKTDSALSVMKEELLSYSVFLLLSGIKKSQVGMSNYRMNSAAYSSELFNSEYFLAAFNSDYGSKVRIWRLVLALAVKWNGELLKIEYAPITEPSSKVSRINSSGSSPTTNSRVPLTTNIISVHSYNLENIFAPDSKDSKVSL